MTITYTPDHYIKGLNIHSVRDLFLPARVSADLDLTFRRQLKKSRLYKKAFLLLAFLEAAEGFTYTFDAHFAKHVKHCAMPLYIMEIETIAELQKLKGEFVQELSGFHSYLGHRGDCCDDNYPPEKKRNDPQAGGNSTLFPRTGESLPPFI